MSAATFRTYRGITSSPPAEHVIENPSKDRGTDLSPFSSSDEIRDERLSYEDFSPILGNATYIDPDEQFIDEDPDTREMEKGRRFELLNRGNHKGKWTIDETLKRQNEDWHFCRALTSQMGLSERSRRLTWRIFKRLDMRSYRGIEPWESENKMKQYLVAFCVGALVYNARQPEDRWKYYPGKEYDEKQERYWGPRARLNASRDGAEWGDRHRTIKRCADEMGFTEDDIQSCIEKVRGELPDWHTND